MIFKKETIERKKRMVTSKERKKNSVYIYILYTQHVFPTFSSFSPTARLIRFPLLPLFLFTPKHLKVQKESHHRRSTVAAIIGKVNSIDAKIISSSRCVYSMWKEKTKEEKTSVGRRKKEKEKSREENNITRPRFLSMQPLRGFKFKFRRLLIPRDFDGRGLLYS